MTLSEFIDRHGDSECASKWGISERAVASWRRGERTPRPDQAKRIIAASGGVLSWDAIYGSPYPEAANA